jgi:hypothetical protein
VSLHIQSRFLWLAWCLLSTCSFILLSGLEIIIGASTLENKGVDPCFWHCARWEVLASEKLLLMIAVLGTSMVYFWNTRNITDTFLTRYSLGTSSACVYVTWKCVREPRTCHNEQILKSSLAVLQKSAGSHTTESYAIPIVHHVPFSHKIVCPWLNDARKCWMRTSHSAVKDVFLAIFYCKNQSFYVAYF